MTEYLKSKKKLPIIVVFNYTTFRKFLKALVLIEKWIVNHFWLFQRFNHDGSNNCFRMKERVPQIVVKQIGSSFSFTFDWSLLDFKERVLKCFYFFQTNQRTHSCLKEKKVLKLVFFFEKVWKLLKFSFSRWFFSKKWIISEKQKK